MIMFYEKPGLGFLNLFKMFNQVYFFSEKINFKKIN